MKIASAAIPGLASGNMIDHRMRDAEALSIRDSALNRPHTDRRCGTIGANVSLGRSETDHRMLAPRLIYHFTHLDNLHQILLDGALLADSMVQGTPKLRVEVGNREVKSRRRLMYVKCPPWGHPSDYVPFYFAPRSPMLYVIHKGNVPHYQDGQNSLVYLVSTIDHVIESGTRWVFADGNCASEITEYYHDIARLETSVDWDVMEAKSWSDTADDSDRMRRRMAEFLVHERFSLDLLVGLATKTTEARAEAEMTFKEHGRSIYTATRPEWYY